MKNEFYGGTSPVNLRNRLRRRSRRRFRQGSQIMQSPFEPYSTGESERFNDELAQDEFAGETFSEFETPSTELVEGDPRIIDLTAQADKSRRFFKRHPKKVWALVLHQMACCYRVKDPLTRFLKMAPHFAILPDGRILQLHPILSLTAASNGFNPGSVAVEFAGNFPDTRGRWWHGAENGQDQVTPAQIEAGRYLVSYLKRTMGLREILAHRQSSDTRDNDPGPDIWYHVGQWAIDNLGLKDGGPGFKTGDGKPIPDLWRNWGQAKPQPELEFSNYEFEVWESEVNRSSSNYVRWVQQALNRILGLQLVVDGDAGVKTRSAIRSFQSQRGLVPPDGIVGPKTEAALLAAGAGPSPGGSGTSISSASAGSLLNIQASPEPNVSDFIDYLYATVRARGKILAPTESALFLEGWAVSWWKLLWVDAVKKFPNVPVTIELVQVGDVSLSPWLYPQAKVFVDQGLLDYMERLHRKHLPGNSNILFGRLAIDARITESIEGALGIKGQLTDLLKKNGVTMSAMDRATHFWFVYASFPNAIAEYVLRPDLVVLDEFDFNKSTLTNVHLAKVNAIARHVVAVARSSRGPVSVGVAGHTDVRGTEKYNQQLGEQRALAVKAALEKALGNQQGQITITATSVGETKPLATATTERAHAGNRRVEVSLPKLPSRTLRVSLRDVAKRALGLLINPARFGVRLTPEQVQRIKCLLLKVTQKGADDRYVDGQMVRTYDVRRVPDWDFILLRDLLSVRDNFGPAVADARILQSLENIDDSIIQGAGTIESIIGPQGGATNKGIEMLLAWMNERRKEDSSIYSCYR